MADSRRVKIPGVRHVERQGQVMALATDRQPYQAWVLCIENVDQLGGQPPRSLTCRGDGEIAERRFRPTLLTGENPRVTRQQGTVSIDLQSPQRLLPEVSLQQHHVAPPV